MKYRKKPVVIEATQWFKNGDHPEDNRETFCVEGGELVLEMEGKVVRYYRNPNVERTQPCPRCNDIMHNHGWIDTLEGGHNVCPSDWIVTGVKGEYYPVKEDIFELTYESMEEAKDDNEHIKYEYKKRKIGIDNYTVGLNIEGERGWQVVNIEYRKKEFYGEWYNVLFMRQITKKEQDGD